MVGLNLVYQTAEASFVADAESGGSSGAMSVLNPAESYDVNACGFKCHLCGVTFPTCIALSDHLVLGHFVKFPHKCRQCGIGTFEATWLTTHKAQCSHRGEIDEPNVSTENGRDGDYQVSTNPSEIMPVIDSGALANHQEEGSADYACRVCDKKFPTERGVVTHTSRKHPKAFANRFEEERQSLIPTEAPLVKESAKKRKQVERSSRVHTSKQAPDENGCAKAPGGRSLTMDREAGIPNSSGTPLPQPAAEGSGQKGGRELRARTPSVVSEPVDTMNGGGRSTRGGREKQSPAVPEDTVSNKSSVSRSVTGKKAGEELVSGTSPKRVRSEDPAPAAHNESVLWNSKKDEVKNDGTRVMGIMKCTICKLSVFSKEMLDRHMKCKHSSPQKSAKRQEKDAISPRKQAAARAPSVGPSPAKVRRLNLLKPAQYRVDSDEEKDDDAEGQNDEVEIVEEPHRPSSSSSSRSSKPAKRSECPVCGLSVNNANLGRHLANHSREGGFECPYCKVVFGEIGNLRRHRKMLHAAPDIHMEELQRKFRLQKCRVLLERVCLEEHQATLPIAATLPEEPTVENEKTGFTCDLCPPGSKGYTSFYHLGIHKSFKHAASRQEEKSELQGAEEVQDEAIEASVEEPAEADEKPPETQQDDEDSDESDEETEQKPYGFCPYCEEDLFNQIAGRRHIIECRAEELKKARADKRVVVLNDLLPHAFHPERQCTGYRCVDCRRCFNFYNQFCLHAATKNIKASNKMSPLYQFLARL